MNENQISSYRRYINRLFYFKKKNILTLTKHLQSIQLQLLLIIIIFTASQIEFLCGLLTKIKCMLKEADRLGLKLFQDQPSYFISLSCKSFKCG